MSNFHKNGPLMLQRGHISSMITLALEQLAREAPEVSFIHCYPGFVKTNIGRQSTGVGKLILQACTTLLGPFIFVPEDEAGARHIYLATSAKYPPFDLGADASGVPLGKDIQVGRGTNGNIGGGVYSVGDDNETAGPKVLKILERLRDEGVDKKLWEHTNREFERIMGEDLL